MKSPKFWQDLTQKQKKDTITTIIIIVVVIGGTFGVMGLVKLILRTNYPLVVVTSESMLPGIEIGDLLVVKGMDPADIEAGDHTNMTGDIIIYETEGIWPSSIPQPVVHRVVDSYLNDTDGKYYFITQGDNNFDTDPPGSPSFEIPVPEDHVLGVVLFKIPKIGKVKMFLDDSGLTWVLIVILSILLVISIIQDLLHPEEDKEEKETLSDEKEFSTKETPPSQDQPPPEPEKFDLGT